jgi:hypothetical protein
LLYYQKQSVQCNLHQTSNDISHTHWKINPETHMEVQKMVIRKETLSKKSNVSGIRTPDCKLQGHSTHMSLARKQWVRWIEDPDINPGSYGHLISDKGSQNTGFLTASSTNVFGKPGYLHEEHWN